MKTAVKDNPFYNQLGFVILLCLTLGLAPFYPEPHIVGKVRWVLGCGKGMGLLDGADLLWHGLPWVMLVRVLAIKYLIK